ncbi:GNAT family N-acetyltransferase [Deinococcus sp. QL22]|uniref:GNAT family N-acetyltransferase n=1 Tax=Deinococcus sp. QL22 TaxID=2939437 RepID=UPI00201776FF|nr:GNAT family N-acetyltransferase [Deinococcus sp. QL22]UQN10019.1 GNAT family N-acetyltransferase [Deinococcus sp. QL22]
MTKTSAPVLHTERLVLRGHQETDFEACVALWSNPVVTRYTTGQPVAPQDVWTRLLRHLGHWMLFGFGYWLVFERSTGRCVGEMGIARFKRDVLKDHAVLDPLPEAGWVLMPWAHGQGFALEALGAILQWRDLNLSQGDTFCLIDPANMPSLRLAAKVGFQPYLKIDSNDKPVEVLLRRGRSP